MKRRQRRDTRWMNSLTGEQREKVLLRALLLALVPTYGSSWNLLEASRFIRQALLTTVKTKSEGQ